MKNDHRVGKYGTSVRHFGGDVFVTVHSETPGADDPLRIIMTPGDVLELIGQLGPAARGALLSNLKRGP